MSETMKDMKEKKWIDFYHLPHDELRKISWELPVDADEGLVWKVEKAIEVQYEVESRKEGIEKEIQELRVILKKKSEVEDREKIINKVKYLKFDLDLVESWVLHTHNVFASLD